MEPPMRRGRQVMAVLRGKVMFPFRTIVANRSVKVFSAFSPSVPWLDFGAVGLPTTVAHRLPTLCTYSHNSQPG